VCLICRWMRGWVAACSSSTVCLVQRRLYCCLFGRWNGKKSSLCVTRSAWRRGCQPRFRTAWNITQSMYRAVNCCRFVMLLKYCCNMNMHQRINKLGDAPYKLTLTPGEPSRHIFVVLLYISLFTNNGSNNTRNTQWIDKEINKR